MYFCVFFSYLIILYYGKTYFIPFFICYHNGHHHWKHIRTGMSAP